MPVESVTVSVAPASIVVPGVGRVLAVISGTVAIASRVAWRAALEPVGFPNRQYSPGDGSVPVGPGAFSVGVEAAFDTTAAGLTLGDWMATVGASLPLEPIVRGRALYRVLAAAEDTECCAELRDLLAALTLRVDALSVGGPFDWEAFVAALTAESIAGVVAPDDSYLV